MGVGTEKTVSWSHTHTHTHTHTQIIVLPSRLAKQQSKLEEEVNSQDSAVSMKQERLESLLPTLENIRKATLPLQEQLDMPLDKRREERELSLYLPS